MILKRIVAVKTIKSSINIKHNKFRLFNVCINNLKLLKNISGLLKYLKINDLMRL